MSIISDPESWMGLRSARAMEDESAARAEPRARLRRAAEPGVLGVMVRRLIRIFGGR